MSKILKNTTIMFQRNSMECCPHCNSVNFIKHGKFKGIQRYKCRNNKCEKTFSLNTKVFCSYSKKDISIWSLYIDSMIEGDSLRLIAKKLKINVATAFYWRRKILATLLLKNEPKELKQYVEMSKFILVENFKGERGARYKEKRKVFVVSAVDSNKTILSKPIAKGFITLNQVKEKVFSKINKHAYIFSYADRVLDAVAKKHNKNIVNNLEVKKQQIHKYNLGVREWLLPFNGVATKYLNTYLSWYISIYKKSMEDVDKLIQELLYYNIYIKCKDFKELYDC